MLCPVAIVVICLALMKQISSGQAVGDIEFIPYEVRVRYFAVLMFLCTVSFMMMIWRVIIIGVY